MHKVERHIAHSALVIETGKLAPQADASVTVKYGNSVVLATTCISREKRSSIDFVPLTVDFEERLYAIGKIPGSFFRREGRPSTEATLSARLVDRMLRPLLPKGLANEVQVVITVLSADQENPPDILSAIAASAVLSLSSVPFSGPVSAVRLAYANNDFLVNPTFTQLTDSTLDIVIANTKEMIVMVEAGAKEVPESVILSAMTKAQEVNAQIIGMIEELARQVGKMKVVVEENAEKKDAYVAVEQLAGGRLLDVLQREEHKPEREASLAELDSRVQQELSEKYSPEVVKSAWADLLRDRVREQILRTGKRLDGRSYAEIRPISCEVGTLPQTHGSGLFQRGLTQVLTITTLASVGMEQTLDTLSPEETKRYLHHYNFPPYATGEVRRIGSPNRRAIGHGALAERALESVIPAKEEFPYTIRLVSEVLSSNGSSSMASVCGSTLSLMDAGVPIKSPVAGVAMGLIVDTDGKATILTDIEGVEDHLGDMDFKVAGTAKGITALQMDTKVKGLTHDILERALEQARQSRVFILGKMNEAIAAPRPELSPLAPKMYRMMIPVEKIGAVIGSGGRVIRSIIEETGASIDIGDDGEVMIGSVDAKAIEKARERVELLTREVKVGDIFTGKVTRIASFGVFVELLPGRDGLVRSSELGDDAQEIKMGQELTVMVTEIDSMGRVNCSRRAVFGGAAQPAGGSRPNDQRPPRFGPPRGRPNNDFRRGDRGERGSGPPRSDRGGFRPGPRRDDWRR
jgi:polyribonucleotide nucleotidyltransferase